VRLSDIDALVNAIESGKDGGLLALPVADTVKRANKENQVAETIPREDLWRALTPQMFRIGTLQAALEKSLSRSSEVTDEAAAIEAVGGHPKLVAGHADNIKITLPGDLALAELFLKQQEKDSE
jgi:2-C-methyl-D-erythritol 4-phosphate cytidylyltransferase